MRRPGWKGVWVLFASATLCLAGSPAAAAAGWSVTTSPSVGAPAGELQSVACPGQTFCIAVGDATGLSGLDAPVIERWNGAAWVHVPAPRPGGPGDDFLLAGVACSSSQACMAVGSYFRSDGTVRTLAERWDGASWSIVDTPNLAGFAQTRLTGVSCVSGGACIAVGEAIGSAGGQTAIAARWNGSAWSLLSVPQAAGTSDSSLSGVSCVSADWCVAVGSLVERWNGTRWSVQRTPDIGYGLSAVSCTATSACTAVGDGIIRSDGARWTLQRASGRSPYLYGVSCVSSDACMAVGEASSQKSSAVGPDAAVWNGRAWTPRHMPRPSDAQYGLPLAIACVSDTSCVAVGRYEYQAGPFASLAYRWDGTRWQLRAVPRPLGPLPGELTAVSCLSRTNCLAVGDHETPAGVERPLAERWDGARWTLLAAAAPAGARASELSGVACVASAAPPSGSTPTGVCFAVGHLSNRGGTYPLIERWTGGTVSIMASPSASAGAELSAVSCSASDACTAVGNLGPDANSLLAERWDGSRWTTESAGHPPDSSASLLNGVSCLAMAGCTAVGAYQLTALDPPEVTLADHRQGHWSKQQTPQGPASGDNQLTAVSCASATACTAVGRGGSAALGQWNVPVVEGWNGSAWTLESAPGLGNLSSVSCASANACIAVGSNSADLLPLAEQWNGISWAVSPTAEPPISPLGGTATLNGVSCPSASLCLAVGRWSTDTGVPVGLPLVEEYTG